MDEKEQLAQELSEIAKKKRGKLTVEQEVQNSEFAESFLLLLNDTDESILPLK